MTPLLLMAWVLGMVNFYLTAAYVVELVRAEPMMVLVFLVIMAVWVVSNLISVLTDEPLPSKPETQLRGAASTSSAECCICYVMTTDWMLPCEHRFHEECIRKWIAAMPTCPLCRAVQ